MEVRHKGHEVTQEARRRWEAAVEQQDSVKSSVGRKKEKMIYETKGGRKHKRRHFICSIYWNKGKVCGTATPLPQPCGHPNLAGNM